MTEKQIRNILYMYGCCLKEHRGVRIVIDEISADILVKAWLKFLPKEDRIIVYMKIIHGYDWTSIKRALESRWGDVGKCTEANLEKRLSKAIGSISTFMIESFPSLSDLVDLT